MPDFILAMEEAQKKAKHAEVPILDIKLTIYAATSVLQSGDYKNEMDKWEGRDASKKTWTKWKQAYLAAYARGVNRQHADATDKLFSQAANLVMLPAANDLMDALAGSLDNLALATTSNRTTVKQLMLQNLLLTTSVVTFTAADKKLTETVACCNLAPQGHSGSRGRGGDGAQHGPEAIWGNYCWVHVYKVLHSSKTCNVIGRKPGHNEAATVADTTGGVDFNKDWYLQGNRAP
jgi:hypothetical protein